MNNVVVKPEYINIGIGSKMIPVMRYEFGVKAEISQWRFLYVNVL